MSELLVTSIYNQEGEGAPNFPKGATVTGVITATSFSGSGANLTGIDATALKDDGGSVKIQANSDGAVVTGILTVSSNVSIAGTLTYEDVTNIDSVGIVTAGGGLQLGRGPSVAAIQSATSTKTSTSEAAVDTFTASTYRSAQYQIQITRGSQYHVTTMNILHDGTNVYTSEFGTIKTGVSLATFDADINSGNVRLLATPTSSDSTVFKMVKNLTLT